MLLIMIKSFAFIGILLTTIIKSYKHPKANIYLYLSTYIMIALDVLKIMYLFLDELDAQSEELMTNNSCTYINEEPNVVGFYNDMEITENVDFPPGSVIISR